MQYEWPLMSDAIGEEEREALVDFINTTDRFTNGPKVREFEQAWSEWLGVKHSVFVNSGSTANMLLVAALKEKHFQEREMVVLSPACTWATNLATLQQFGIRFVVADNDLHHFGFSEESLREARAQHPDINVVWVTHLLGSPTDMAPIHEHFPEALVIEDCCESHGAFEHSQEKPVGTLGAGSTFSFYYGHHMTTIEGGMVCTDDDDLYQMLRMLRSHGMSREVTDTQLKTSIEATHPEIDPRFLFPYGGFNFRNTELGAVLGLVQLRKLDDFIDQRVCNLADFDEIISQYPESLLRFNLQGNSGMTLPFICRTEAIRNRLIEALESAGIETRPFLVGNILVQPFLESHEATLATPNADHLHRCALYIGNSQFVSEADLEKLSTILAGVLG